MLVKLMAKQLTDELYDVAAEELQAVKNTTEVGKFTVKLSPQEELIWREIPDKYKQTALSILARSVTYDPKYDYRLRLVQRGLIELWENRRNLAKSYRIGFEAREDILEEIDG
jgi:hypothetical protein